MTETWVLLFWVMLGGHDGGMSATSQAIQFQNEAACRAGVSEIFAGLDPAYKEDETGHAMGVHAICLRTDAVDTVTLEEVNRALQDQQAAE